MGLPAWAYGAIASGATAAAGLYASKKQSDAAKQMSEEEIKLKQQELALQQSQLNPFRTQAAQAATAGVLDRMQNGAYTPVSVQAPARYAASVPQISGGYSYQKSPELVHGAQVLKNSVLSGQGAPNMLDPNNAGITNTINTMDPNVTGTGGSSSPTAAPPSLSNDFNDLTMSYDRRGGGTGGVLKGAANGASAASTVAPFTGPAAPFVIGGGAVAGAVVGAFKKHAKTAPTDFRVEDARTVLAQAYEKYQGRQAAPEEIERLIQSQGWQPGDRWVGQQGLMGLITAISQHKA